MLIVVEEAEWGLYADKYMNIELYNWREEDEVDSVGNRRLTVWRPLIGPSDYCVGGQINFNSRERATLTYTYRI